MCRNIKVLYNFVPPATEEEVRGAALQFVRKITGFGKPSAANQAVFDRAVDQITETASVLLNSLVTTALHRNRTTEPARAHGRSASRSGVRRPIT